jgi:hypothetical protein
MRGIRAACLFGAHHAVIAAGLDEGVVAAPASAAAINTTDSITAAPTRLRPPPTSSYGDRHRLERGVGVVTAAPDRVPLDLFGNPEPVVDFDSRPTATSDLGELIDRSSTRVATRN